MATDDTTPTAVEFAALLRREQTRLYNYIHSLVRDLNDADDLFQQTTLVLWKKFGEFDPARSFFAWACGVARLEVANFLRSRGRQRLYFSDDLNLLLIEAQTEVSADEAEARRYFVRYAALHTDLHLAARARLAAERALGRLAQDGASDQPRAPARGKRMPLAGARGWLAVAAGALLALAATWWSLSARTP